VFADSAALLSGERTSVPWEANGTRFQAYDGVLYHAWHATNQVRRLDLGSGLELGPVTLESYDTWVWGIGVNDTYLHLIDDGRGVGNPVWDSRIARFLHDGTLVDEVFIERQLYGRASGLWCR
jgi:hypothetical protein